MVIAAPLGTSFAWYWLFSRYVVNRWAPALLGGAFCGFAPGMVAQTNGHPNIAAQFLVPLVVLAGCKLGTPGRAVRNGLRLGLLVACQFFLNEEILFVTAIGSAVFVAAWALLHRERAATQVRTFARGLVVAVSVVLVIVAFPLYYQFFGPQHYNGLATIASAHDGTDIMSFFAFPTSSLAGNADSVRLAPNLVEENAFFGWPLAGLLVVTTLVLWHNRLARAGAAVAVAFGVLALGSHLHVNGHASHIPGPWWPLRHLPLFDSVIITRLALAMVPPIAMLLALLADQIASYELGPRPRMPRLLMFSAIAVALLPLVPTALPAIGRPEVPLFIASGEWRSMVPAGRTLVPVPIPNPHFPSQTLQWALTQNLDLRFPSGYFIGPDDSPKHTGRFGPSPRPTTDLLDRVAVTGDYVVAASDREKAREDLRYWRAAIVVLAPQRNEDALRNATSTLLGFQPAWKDGLWVWDVRDRV
jgi:hypothetical protein